MGAPKTKSVGGGSNTKTADAWNGFLQGQLGTGPASGPGQAVGQTGNFQNMINSVSQQTPQSIADQNPWLSQALNINKQAPTYTDPNLQSLNNGIQGSTVNDQFNASVPGFQNINDIISMLGGNIQNIMGGAVNASFDPNSVARQGDVLSGPNTIGGLLDPNNDPTIAAQRQYLDRQTQMNIANSRARYGMGGRGLSSGASLAEAQVGAESAGQNALTMQQIINAQQGLDIQNRGQNISGLLGQQGNLINQRSQDISSGTNQAINNSQVGTQASINNSNNNLQAQTANAQNRIAGIGQMNNFNIARMAQSLQAMGMDADSALQTAIQNNAATQNMNTNQLNNSGMQNNFNMQNFGQQSQNSGMIAQLGQAIQQMLSGNQNNLMNQLFGAFGQSNQIGSPQAQTIQTPNAWQQAIGGISNVLGLGKGIMGMFGGGSPLGGMSGGNNSGLPGMSTGGNINGSFPGMTNPFSGSMPGMGNGQSIMDQLRNQPRPVLYGAQ